MKINFNFKNSSAKKSSPLQDPEDMFGGLFNGAKDIDDDARAMIKEKSKDMRERMIKLGVPESAIPADFMELSEEENQKMLEEVEKAAVAKSMDHLKGSSPREQALGEMAVRLRLHVVKRDLFVYKQAVDYSAFEAANNVSATVDDHIEGILDIMLTSIPKETEKKAAKKRVTK